jgi:hypothetical protein
MIDKAAGNSELGANLRTARENPGGLSFQSIDDAIDMASHLAEEGKRRHSFEDFNIVEGYEKGRLKIVIQIEIFSASAKYEFAFFAVPFGADGRGPSGPLKRVPIYCSHLSSDCDKATMFGGVGKRTERPQKIIPSFVRLQGGHNSCDFVRDFLLDGPHAFFKLSLPRAKREGDTGKVGAWIGRKSACTGGVIQGAAQIVEDVADDWEKKSRYLVGQPELAQIFSGLRIYVFENGVGCAVEERLRASLEFVAVFASAVQ